MRFSNQIRALSPVFAAKARFFTAQYAVIRAVIRRIGALNESATGDISFLCEIIGREAVSYYPATIPPRLSLQFCPAWVT
jgi:hypothetical protein